MSGNQKRPWKVWLRDGAIGFGFSLLFLYLTFPWDAVRERLEQELSQAASSPQAPTQVTVGQLHPSFGTGVILEHVTFSRGDSSGSARTVQLPEVRARISLWGLLRGQRAVTFSAKVFGGQVEGEVVDAKNLSSLSLDVAGLQLAQTRDVLAFLAGPPGASANESDFPIDISTIEPGGVVDAKLKLAFKPNDFASLKGTLSVDVEHALISGGLPKTDLGKIELKSHFQEGKLDIERFQVGGEDINGETDGVLLRLNQNLPLSMISGKAKVRFGTEYQKQIPVGSIISFKYNKQPDRDGYFVLSLGGTLKDPRIL